MALTDELRLVAARLIGVKPEHIDSITPVAYKVQVTQPMNGDGISSGGTRTETHTIQVHLS
jgi:hypothetical protein